VWYLNISGEDLPVNERQLVYKNGSLLLVGISRDDAGTYRCSVTSSKHLTASGDIAVTVMGKQKLNIDHLNSGVF
jgi:hypothetical protein